MRLDNLVSLEECAQKLGGAVPVERLRELAESSHLPHVVLDGRVLVRVDRVEQWVSKNLLSRKCFGADLPVVLQVFSEAQTPPRIPSALVPMAEHLRVVPTARYPSGIYFLVRDDAVVYVGQSGDVLHRVVNHMHSEKKFDYALYCPVPASRLDEVEGAFIRHLRPRLCGGAPADRGSDGGVLSEFGMHLPSPSA